MYSCVFWEWIHRFSRFFGYYCVTPVTPFIRRSKGCPRRLRLHRKQSAVRTLSTRPKPIKQQIFSLLHLSKSLKAKSPHVCCWKGAFSRAMSKIFFPQTLWSREWTHGVGPTTEGTWLSQQRKPALTNVSCSLNFIRLLQVVITHPVTSLLRGENDSEQSDEIQTTFVVVVVWITITGFVESYA